MKCKKTKGKKSRKYSLGIAYERFMLSIWGRVTFVVLLVALATCVFLQIILAADGRHRDETRNGELTSVIRPVIDDWLVENAEAVSVRDSVFIESTDNKILNH